ncbi:hypothetical protein BP6252_02856 [Coleophoma cylindrospora]|uniref:Uncharacterized protein n=1 Tax=Coleophoma cylindrospora TaxID=1849047 RepID=A0A3D8SG45_9HELO|nr:hypothetical protein BP6252_02856 [Coleophoma cylindrospora]
MIVLPIWLLSTILWARFTSINYGAPKVPQIRLAIGAIALCFLLLTEAVSSLVLHNIGWTAWVWEKDTSPAVAAIMAVLYGLMPFLISNLEAKEIKEVYDSKN